MSVLKSLSKSMKISRSTKPKRGIATPKLKKAIAKTVSTALAAKATSVPYKFGRAEVARWNEFERVKGLPDCVRLGQTTKGVHVIAILMPDDTWKHFAMISIDERNDTIECFKYMTQQAKKTKPTVSAKSVALAVTKTKKKAAPKKAAPKTEKKTMGASSALKGMLRGILKKA